MARLKVLFVSDVHYRKDMDGEGSMMTSGLSKLEEVIDRERPNLTISAGDWDLGFDEEAFERVTGRTYLLTIYGNHENRKAIEAARNSDGRPVLLPDGEPVEFDSLTVAGISGNIGGGSKWHHKKPEEFEMHAERLMEAQVDVMVTHEPPANVPFYPDNPYGRRVIAKAIRLVRPNMHFSGHVDYPTQCVRYEGKWFLHVDSQPPAFEYAIGMFEDNSLREMKIGRRPTAPLKEGPGDLRTAWPSSLG